MVVLLKLQVLKKNGVSRCHLLKKRRGLRDRSDQGADEDEDWSSSSTQDDREEEEEEEEEDDDDRGAASSFTTPPRSAPLGKEGENDQEGDSFWAVDSKGLHEKSREFATAARLLRATREFEATTEFEQHLLGEGSGEGSDYLQVQSQVDHIVAGDISITSAAASQSPVAPSSSSHEKDFDDGVVLGAAGAGFEERFEAVLREGCDLKCLFVYATPPAGYSAAKKADDGDQGGSTPGVVITNVMLTLASRQTDGSDYDDADG